MKLADDNGLCPGCQRSAQTCRDSVPCPHRRRYVQLFCSASVEKPPYKLTERAVRVELGLIQRGDVAK